MALPHNRLSVEIPGSGEIVRAPGCADLQGEPCDITNLLANSSLALAPGFVHQEDENQQRKKTHGERVEGGWSRAVRSQSAAAWM